MSGNPKILPPEEVIANLEQFIFDMAADYTEQFPCYDFLQNKGWLRFSSGSFANVYCSLCGNYVLKINTHDDLYPYYAQIAIEDPSNPYLPNIYWHVALVNNRSNIKTITLMENLSHAGLFEPFIDKGARALLSIPRRALFLKVYGKKMTFFSKLMSFLKWRRKIKNEHIISIMNRLEDTIHKYGLNHMRVDFVMSNLRARGKQIVIIDPIY